MRRVRTLKDVVDWGLCIGCGACAYACDRGGVRLVNFPDRGIRPVFSDACAECTKCLPVCPGYEVDTELTGAHLPKSSRGDFEFGPALAIYEGHAADPEIRFNASSGGALTALALYCLEREGMGQAVHIGADPDSPLENRVVASLNRQQLLACTGSRYAPASPCAGLGLIAQSEKPSVFIGKPCDTTGAFLAARMRPELREKLGLVLTFFCAGTPSTNGTAGLLEHLGMDHGAVEHVRYRGRGWPGRFTATAAAGEQGSLSYEESWGMLNKHRSFRCHLCPDGLGRIADVSCGDAWHAHGGGDDPGRSLLLARTERGAEMVRKAAEAGYLELTPRTQETVLQAQPNLLSKRHQLFGRLLAMRLLAVPAPKLRGFNLLRGWWALSPGWKARTVGGTLRRLVSRGLWRRQPLPVLDAKERE